MVDLDKTAEILGFVSHLECLNCGEKYDLHRLKHEQGTILVNICYDLCMGPLDIKYDLEKVKNVLTKAELNKRHDTYWKLKELLPVNEILVDKDRKFSPLIESRRIGKELGIKLFFKLDSSETNPTKSFKDRPVTMAFNKALEAGYSTVFVASTGNLGISTAYFAKKLGLNCRVYVPKSLGEVKKNAIRKFLPNSNDLIEFDGSYDDANIKSMSDADVENDNALKSGKSKHVFVPNNSFRPYYKEGSKTSGTEIAQQILKFVDKSVELKIVYPLGSGALFCSAFKGINELKELDLFQNPVKMYGVQPEQCSPIIDALKTGELIPVKNPQTIAKSIAIGKPGSGHQTIDVIKKSNGTGWKVSEKAIYEANLELFFKEGIFSQFVGGTTLAGIKRGVEAGDIEKGDIVIANITGTGKNRIEDDLLEFGKKFGYLNEVKQLLASI